MKRERAVGFFEYWIELSKNIFNFRLNSYLSFWPEGSNRECLLVPSHQLSMTQVSLFA